MNKEVVIIKHFIIDKPSQVVVFDIKLPRQTKQIIGIELGMQWLLGRHPIQPSFSSNNFLKMQRSSRIGELKLQSYERSTVFYACDLSLNQNINYGELAGKQFQPTTSTHQLHSLEDPINVGGEITLVQGIYKDQVQLNTPYRYRVNVYVWLENK